MQVCLGLSYLHERDSVYRNLKLENALTDENENVCLTDFGMAKMVIDEELQKYAEFLNILRHKP